MDKYAILVNIDKCVGCGACTAACKAYYDLSQGIFRTKVERFETGVFPSVNVHNVLHRCMHCETPSCVEVCPTGALEKTPEGPVIYNPDLCVGCKFCVEACPYGVPQFDEEKRRIEKCSMCYDRVKRGLLPVCVEVCPTGALEFGSREDLLAKAKSSAKYVWGENEGGGTCVIYASSTPMEELGFPRQVPAPIVWWRKNVVEPAGWAIVGITALGALAHMIYWRAKRMEQIDEENREVEEKG